eukprot:m.24420 g.24420  ORF g.24420 m.24420 type:complete len:373 (-) comp8687_c0_seq1:36-1154(-)
MAIDWIKDGALQFRRPQHRVVAPAMQDPHGRGRADKERGRRVLLLDGQKASRGNPSAAPPITVNLVASTTGQAQIHQRLLAAAVLADHGGNVAAKVGAHGLHPAARHQRQQQHHQPALAAEQGDVPINKGHGDIERHARAHDHRRSEEKLVGRRRAPRLRLQMTCHCHRRCRRRRHSCSSGSRGRHKWMKVGTFSVGERSGGTGQECGECGLESAQVFRNNHHGFGCAACTPQTHGNRPHQRLAPLTWRDCQRITRVHAAITRRQRRMQELLNQQRLHAGDEPTRPILMLDKEALKGILIIKLEALEPRALDDGKLFWRERLWPQQRTELDVVIFRQRHWLSVLCHPQNLLLYLMDKRSRGPFSKQRVRTRG